MFPPRPQRPDSVDVLFICTGNAARSVMGAASLSARREDLVVASAGTLVIPGQPMSLRTRAAIVALADRGVQLPHHSSHQVTPAELDRAAIVVALAPEHVEWVRRNHPDAAGHTVTLKRLVRDVAPGESLRSQAAALGLRDIEVEPWEEVVDPGGGDHALYAECAVEVDDLVAAVAPCLAGRAVSVAGPA